MKDIEKDYLYDSINQRLKEAEKKKEISYSRLEAAADAHVLNEAHTLFAILLNENLKYESVEEKLRYYFSEQTLAPIIEPLLSYFPPELFVGLKKLQTTGDPDKRERIISTWLSSLSAKDMKALNKMISLTESKVKLWQYVPWLFKKTANMHQIEDIRDDFKKNYLDDYNELKDKKNRNKKEEDYYQKLNSEYFKIRSFEAIFSPGEDVLDPLYFRNLPDYQNAGGLNDSLVNKIEEGKIQLSGKRPHYFRQLWAYVEEGLLTKDEFVFKVKEDIELQTRWGYRKLSGFDDADWRPESSKEKFPPLDLQASRWKTLYEIDKRK